MKTILPVQTQFTTITGELAKMGYVLAIQQNRKRVNYSTGTGTTGTGLTHPERSKQGSKSGKESGSLFNQSGNGVESEGESDTQSDWDPFQVEEVGEPTLRKMFNVRFSGNSVSSEWKRLITKRAMKWKQSHSEWKNLI